ncbi:hypothetical protein GE09DRAFT_587189 [Coniochaeta sp. 2T2.1]|nr:hypothetical protein GE09DRAFT_587189 [Coniochaeta sp. 2T2.1]
MVWDGTMHAIWQSCHARVGHPISDIQSYSTASGTSISEEVEALYHRTTERVGDVTGAANKGCATGPSLWRRLAKSLTLLHPCRNRHPQTSAVAGANTLRLGRFHILAGSIDDFFTASPICDPSSGLCCLNSDRVDDNGKPLSVLYEVRLASFAIHSTRLPSSGALRPPTFSRPEHVQKEPSQPSTKSSRRLSSGPQRADLDRPTPQTRTMFFPHLPHVRSDPVVEPPECVRRYAHTSPPSPRLFPALPANARQVKDVTRSPRLTMRESNDHLNGDGDLI